MSSSKSRQLSSWVGSAFKRVAPTTDNLFRSFTPRVPMGVPGTSREKRLVEMDVPPKLQQQLDKGLLLIGDDCLKENAEYVLEVFQTIILEWVISKEVSDKRLRKILANNPFLESLDPDGVRRQPPSPRNPG